MRASQHGGGVDLQHVLAAQLLQRVGQPVLLCPWRALPCTTSACGHVIVNVHKTARMLIWHILASNKVPELYY